MWLKHRVSFVCRRIAFLLVLLLLNQPFILHASERVPSVYSNSQILSEMVVLGLTEQSVSEQHALVLTFSQALNPASLIDDASFITVTLDGKRVEGQWSLTTDPKKIYFTPIEPARTYRVQLRAGLSAQNGLKLNKAFDVTLETRPIAAEFDFAVLGKILPPRLTDGLPIRVVNIPEVDLEFLRVSPENLPKVLEKIQINQGFDVYDLNTIQPLAQSVYNMRYHTAAKPNVHELRLVPVETIPELQQSGLYFVVMRQPGHFGEQAYRVGYFLVSDMGLHIRRYRQALDVWVNSLTSGQALPDTIVSLYTRKGKNLTIKSNSQGYAHFKLVEDEGVIVLAQQGMQLGFVDLRDSPLKLAGEIAGGEVDQPIKAFIYSGRQIFQPNEIIDVSVLLRNRDGATVPIKAIYVRVKRPNGKSLSEQLVALHPAELGYFYTNFRLPDDAESGAWQVEVRLKPDDPPLNKFDFTVYEYNPEYLHLSINSPAPLIQAPNNIILALQGELMQAVPTRGYAVKVTSQLRVESHPIASLPDFYFGDPRDNKNWMTAETQTLQLNEQGSGFLNLPMTQYKIQSPLILDINAQLDELGGRQIQRSLVQRYWPHTALVGIRPLFSDALVDEVTPAGFEIAQVDAQGKKLAVEGLIVSLVKVEHDVYWDYSAGWQRRLTTRYEPISQQTITLADGQSQQVQFPVITGDYWLEVEDPMTRLKAAYPFHVGWRWQELTAQQPDLVKLSLDKVAYQLGEIAKVTITPPSAGEAIVMIEGDELLWSQRIVLPEGGASVDIPLSESWQRHDLYVSVLLLRPAQQKHYRLPARATGLIHLPLDRQARRLDLKLDLPQTVQPDQEISVKVTATNLRQQPALVTLSAIATQAVDNTVEKVKVPNPWDYFYAPHRYQVNHYDVYSKISESGAMQAPMLSFSALPPAQSSWRYNAPEIPAVFKTAVMFDDKGEATIPLTIPTMIGQLRLSAIAIAERQLGLMSRDIMVNVPVTLQANLPKHLTTHDSTYLTVNMVNRSEQTQSVQLRIRHDELLTLAAPSESEYTLEKNQSKTLHLPLKVANQAGQAQISLSVVSKNFRLQQDLRSNIRLPNPVQLRSRLYTISREDGAVTLDRTIMQGLNGGSLQARLTLAAKPELGARNALESLRYGFVYQSVDQLVNRTYPYLVLDKTYADYLGIAEISLAQRATYIQNTLARLEYLQLVTGGFARWSSQTTPDSELSLDVTDFLLDVQEQGFTVPESLLLPALNYIEAILVASTDNNQQDGFTEAQRFALRAHAAYVLARVERVSLGDLRAWYDQGSQQSRSGLALIRMGLALYKRADAQRSREAFKQGLEQLGDATKVDTTDIGSKYGSQIRDQALLLALLLHHKQPIESLDAHLKVLNQAIYKRNYLSAHEQAAIVLLSRQLSHLPQADVWGAQVLLQSRGISVRQANPYRLAVKANDLQVGLTVTTDNVPLNTSLEVSGYHDTPPIQPTEREVGIEAKRIVYDINGRIKDMDSLQLGELLIVQMQVTSPNDIQEALVVDMLAGALALEQRPILGNTELMSTILEGSDSSISQLMGTSPLVVEQFAPDRYWAVLPLTKQKTHSLFYLARVVEAGTFSQPMISVIDWTYPEQWGASLPTPLLIVPKVP